MSEKKGFFAALFGGGKSGGCCNMEITEEPKKKGGCCDMEITEEPKKKGGCCDMEIVEEESQQDTEATPNS